MTEESFTESESRRAEEVRELEKKIGQAERHERPRTLYIIFKDGKVHDAWELLDNSETNGDYDALRHIRDLNDDPRRPDSGIRIDLDDQPPSAAELKNVFESAGLAVQGIWDANGNKLA